MDILDVSITIKEFQLEWTLRYSPNDISFWAALLDSDLPTQQQCAFMLFEAWGRESVLDEYEKWLELVKRRDQLSQEHKSRLIREHEMYKRSTVMSQCQCYDCEEHTYPVFNDPGLSMRESRHARGKYTEYEKACMTWDRYFKTFVFGKGV